MSATFPECPADLTVSALISAKGAQLKFWTDGANKVARAARQPVIAKKQKVDALRASLAGHYGLDLSIIPTVAVEGPAPIGQVIRSAQWGGLRDLGKEWKTVVAAGGTFNLLAGSTGVFLCF